MLGVCGACYDVPLVEFMYLVFTRMPGESYRRRLGFLLLCLCYVFRALLSRRFPEITGEDNLTVFSYSLNGGGSGEEPICDSFRSSGIDLL